MDKIQKRRDSVLYAIIRTLSVLISIALFKAILLPLLCVITTKLVVFLLVLEKDFQIFPRNKSDSFIYLNTVVAILMSIAVIVW
jgi:hypothetical protein